MAPNVTLLSKKSVCHLRTNQGRNQRWIVGFVIHCLFWIEPKSSKTRRLKMRLYLGIKWLNIGHKADLTKIKGYSKNVAWGVNLRLSVFLCDGLRKMGSWQREEGSNDIVHGRTSLTSILGSIYLLYFFNLGSHEQDFWDMFERRKMFTMEEFLTKNSFSFKGEHWWRAASHLSLELNSSSRRTLKVCKSLFLFLASIIQASPWMHCLCVSGAWPIDC